MVFKRNENGKIAVKRQKFLDKNNGHCVYCGCKIKSIDDFCYDYIIPKSRGGRGFADNNVVVACRKCNDLKGNRTPYEFIEKIESFIRITETNYKHCKKILSRTDEIIGLI